MGTLHITILSRGYLHNCQLLRTLRTNEPIRFKERKALREEVDLKPEGNRLWLPKQVDQASETELKGTNRQHSGQMSQNIQN